MHDVEWKGVRIGVLYLCSDCVREPCALELVHVVVGVLAVGLKILAGRNGRPTKKYKSASPCYGTINTHPGVGLGW